MRTRLWTVHTHVRDRAGRDFRTVADRFRPLALLLPPLWAAVEGLWLAAAALLTGQFALFAMLSPAHALAVWAGVMAAAGWEGASLARLELRLRGWREAGLVEAASRDGADECWLAGRAVRL